MRTLVLLAMLGLVAAPALGVAPEPAATSPGARVDASLAALAGAAGVPPMTLDPVPCGSLADALASFAARLGVPLPAAATPVLAPAEERALAQLVCAMDAANRARDEVYRGIDMDALAREVAAGKVELDVELSPAHVAVNAAGAQLIARAVDEVIAALPARSAIAPTERAPPQYDLFPVLAMDLVGVDTVYARDYALVVDVGGDDLYANNAGGSLIAFGNGGFIPVHGDPATFGPSVCLTPQCARLVVGGDFEDAELLFSASALLDLAGDDTYGVRRAPYHDAICTSEPVVRKVVIQGTGAGGPGLLFDLGGDNHFVAKTVAQGVGHAGGVGVLYLGAGKDTLEAVRLAQGTGLFFGLGLLLDEGGDDRYLSVVPQGGVLNTDNGECDAVPRYLHGTGFARTTGGASGVAGAFIDAGGDDTYVSGTKTTGFAEVASVGFFLDVDGDDTYLTAARALGFASGHPGTSGGGLAVFLDDAGNDVYVLTEGQGLGATPGRLATSEDVPMPYTPATFWVNELVTIFVDPILISGGATFYDGGGHDLYVGPEMRANGETKPTTVGGLFIDRE